VTQNAVERPGIDHPLEDTRHAFDGVAARYHDENVDNPLLAAMRRRVVDIVLEHVPRGAHILDLGCGPGTDAQRLGREGYRVTAIDWSLEMVRQASSRIRESRLEHRVFVRHLGIHELDALAPLRFDGALSNFGALNCVPDMTDVPRRLAARLNPGAVAVLNVIGRHCPWELAIFLARRDLNRARTRHANAAVPVPHNGRTVWTRYYSPRELERTFAAAGFLPTYRRALGLLVPPPYARSFAERHRRLVAALWTVEDTVAAWPLLREMGDHFVSVLRRS
jgi:2-polyprenyl-3-methyl-5-hydroxy-6-metoxy-1,4-benzoquinol methylase